MESLLAHRPLDMDGEETEVNDDERQRLHELVAKYEKKASDRGVIIIYLIILIVVVWIALW